MASGTPLCHHRAPQRILGCLPQRADMRRALLPFAFLIVATATATAQKRPLALEDYYRIRTVGTPRISPNSRWVTYTVATPVEETNSDRTEAFLVPRSEEHTSELQSRLHLVCRLLLEKKKKNQ